VASDWKVNMPGVRDRKRKMVDGLLAMHLDKFKASGAELVVGHGRFVAPKTIEVALPDGETRVMRGEIVVISTGTRGEKWGNSAAPSRVSTRGSRMGLSTIRHLSGGRVALFPIFGCSHFWLREAL
jgi:pyruvate/2-oxoglutarate dehydrogenase complex dihydrolipoamide dehydrogenase (E3) component